MRKKFSFVTLLLIMMMTAMFSMEAFAATGNQDWKWPVPGSDRMSSCYIDGRNHYAIDIQADRGEEIYASYVGEVVAVYNSCTHNYSKYYSCGCDSGLGNNVYIRHIYNGKNYVSRYGHLTDVYVSVGDLVDQETVIGTVGSTGYSSGNHLDFRVYKGYADAEDGRQNAIDPLMEQFIELPETFHANATTWCCYEYEDEVKALYAENPKAEESEMVMSRAMGNQQKNYLCDNLFMQIQVAVHGSNHEH